MNASDIVKAKQDRVLYQAYYRPSNLTNIVSSITTCPISSIGSSGVSSVTTTSTIHYLSKCGPNFIDYSLANNVKNGTYLCAYPYCSSISEWNTGMTYPTGTCGCKITFTTWKNTNPTIIYNYSSIISGSTVTGVNITSTSINTGPSPLICPLGNFIQGPNLSACVENSCK